MTLYYTGMRVGELCALTPADVDLEGHTITINKTFQRINGRDVIWPPKTPKSNRVVTIPQTLANCLKEYMDKCYEIQLDDRLFPYTKSFLNHEMLRGCKKSGVKKIRVHDLRHPYVKHTTKKYNSEKQKTQTTNLSADSLGFLFLYRQLFKEVMDLVDNLYTVVREYIYLFNQQIGQLGS